MIAINLALSEKEQTFVRLGRQIANDPHGISDSLFAAVEWYLGPNEIVTLTAFAGMMVATNIINNVLKVDLDEYLEAYRAYSVSSQAGEHDGISVQQSTTFEARTGSTGRESGL